MKHKQALYSMIAVLAMAGIFLQGAPAWADSGRQPLRSRLGEIGVVARLVKLDRDDGFSYGLSFRGRGLPLVILAPGLHRDWLVQIDGAEALLQADRAGNLQVIAQSDDFWIWVCYFKQLTTFLTNIIPCTTPLCFTDKFLSLLIGLGNCQPEEPDYRITGR